MDDIQEPIGDMSDVKKQVEGFRDCMEKYNIRGQDSVLLLDPSPNEVNDELDEINRQLREGKNKIPSINIFTVFLFAGLGVRY